LTEVSLLPLSLLSQRLLIFLYLFGCHEIHHYQLVGARLSAKHHVLQ
jgi:hypothetical protein